MDHALDLLENARNKGASSIACIEALSYLCRLWTLLMEDLANPDNDLPEVLRADLLSVGIWILKETDAIQKGTSDNLVGLIEICTLIRDGLK
ncbi:flagellar FlaF family protein [Beijerinckia indica subsp. indica ATCC 9039]|uniref:Flagellar FlaF family protein n=2 Tax=Beijerinckia TaxID=532 RepID=B2IG37_BEII9|nr:flagellar FlaF family protein [Beijerinckia indica subsp. indica ATCC 9039]